ncbi:MAG: hypothetical protein C0596_04575 [Marinilabiliales bacterium]|nr:MAG: hypothetical protein C0596_04575 [Marinilabiliales bacterium]
MQNKILFIDTETGGLDPQKYSLLSVCLVVWENNQITKTKEILINDGVLYVTDEALSINNINIEEHKKLAIPSIDAILEIKQFVKETFFHKEKITLAGHNVQFDLNFLKQLFYKHDESFHSIFSHRIIDTSSILYYLFLS